MSTCLKQPGKGWDEGQEQVRTLLQHFSGALSRTVMLGHTEGALVLSSAVALQGWLWKYG